MRTLLLLPILFLFTGCGPDAPCQSLTLGLPIAGLPKSRIDGLSIGGRSDFATRMRSPAPGPPGDFDNGPVDAHLCCHSKRVNQPLAWCSPQQLDCSDAQFEGVELYHLRYPYYAEHGDDAGRFCIVAAKDGVIVAIWARWWS